VNLLQQLIVLHQSIIACRRCSRLVRWRESVARARIKRFSGEEYWGKPLPGFGDPKARLLIVGLAPAAHGGNRTGRMFTGDRSGDWLFRALHKAEFANQPTSEHRRDGLRLTDCYITAAVRCAPPENKPTPEEFQNCRPYLIEEIKLLNHIRVVIGLGKIGFESAIKAFREAGKIPPGRTPRFAHGSMINFGEMTFIASYHPSQQNTFTGKLTEKMFNQVFRKATTAIRAHQ
jgi:uracil-DNA glycosylase family 4